MQESRLTTLTRRGLMLPAEVREEIRKTGIRCRPQVEIVNQERAKQWRLRAEESGGAVALFGHYVGFLKADGTPMACLQRKTINRPAGDTWSVHGVERPVEASICFKVDAKTSQTLQLHAQPDLGCGGHTVCTSRCEHEARSP